MLSADAGSNRGEFGNGGWDLWGIPSPGPSTPPPPKQPAPRRAVEKRLGYHEGDIGGGGMGGGRLDRGWMSVRGHVVSCRASSVGGWYVMRPVSGLKAKSGCAQGVLAAHGRKILPWATGEGRLTPFFSAVLGGIFAVVSAIGRRRG